MIKKWYAIKMLIHLHVAFHVNMYQYNTTITILDFHVDNHMYSFKTDYRWSAPNINSSSMYSYNVCIHTHTHTYNNPMRSSSFPRIIGQEIPIMDCLTIFMMTSSNGNIFRVTGPLRGEFTGDRWIPRTKASDAELWRFLWSASE